MLAVPVVVALVGLAGGEVARRAGRPSLAEGFRWVGFVALYAGLRTNVVFFLLCFGIHGLAWFLFACQPPPLVSEPAGTGLNPAELEG